jgi:hypothetical protein
VTYTIEQLIPFIKDNTNDGRVPACLFEEIPRLTGQEYDFHYLRGFIEGVRGWL